MSECKLCKARKHVFRKFAGRSRSHPRDGTGSPRKAYVNASPCHIGSTTTQRRLRLCEQDRQIMQEVLLTFKPHRCPSSEEVERMRQLLQAIYEDGDISLEIDDNGLNIIQWSVIWNCDDLLADIILMKGYWHNVNAYACNAPLHLACKFGNRNTVRFLLQNGADVNLKSTACYPMRGLHTISHSKHYGKKALCFIHSMDKPLKVAFRRDNVEVVKELLQNDHSKDLIDTTCILHDACQVDAKRCCEYLIKTFPEKINERKGRTGESPVGVAIRSAEACVEILLESGAKMHEDTLKDCTGKKETVLHALYSSPSCVHLYTLSQLTTLNAPLEDLVECRDKEGNTPLHVLCKHVGKRIQDNEKQDTRDKDTVMTIRLLLEHGANPEALNNKGETPLHMLFEDNCSRQLYGMGANYHVNVMGEINENLELILSLKPDLNLNYNSENVSSVINRTIRIICSMEAFHVKTAGRKVTHSLRLLCKNGANPTIPDQKGIYILTRVLTAANRWLNHSSDNRQLTIGVFDVTRELVELLFSHGPPTPEDVLKLGVKQVAIMTNIHFTDESFLAHMKTLLIPIFNAGLDPNYIGTVHSSNPEVDVKADDVLYFIARAFIINHKNEAMLQFLSVFIENMTQMNLNHLKKAICKVLRKHFLKTSPFDTKKAIKIIEGNLQAPRSLSTLCKAAINRSLGWKLAEGVCQLPLPTDLKEYLYYSGTKFIH